jgi:hypothetical protein
MRVFMSQRLFKNNKYNVLTGWDRPLQYWFLVITNKKGGLVFSNLQLLHPMSLSRVIRECLDRNIEIPKTLASDLISDKKVNRGNYTYDYSLTKEENRDNSETELLIHDMIEKCPHEGKLFPGSRICRDCGVIIGDE